MLRMANKSRQWNKSFHHWRTHSILFAPENTTKDRDYHTTPRNELVLYGTIILVAGIGYAAHQMYKGEPLTPKSALNAQAEYRRLEEERDRRNEQSKRQTANVANNVDNQCSDKKE